MDDENDRETVELEQLAEEVAAEQLHEYDAHLIDQLARAVDPDAWLPKHMPDAESLRKFAVIQWAARRMIAHEHATRALPWVKAQCLAAYQEGAAAMDAEDRL